MKTKILSILLTVCMLFGVFAMSAAAETNTTVGYSFDRITRKTAAELAEIKEITALTEGTDTDDGVYKISTPASLVAFSNYANTAQTMKGITVLLVADLDMTGISMAPISSVSGKRNTDLKVFFAGTFDGQGYTIDNLVIDNSSVGADGVAALFGLVSGATIKNVVLGSGCSFTTDGANSSYAGSIAALSGNLNGGGKAHTYFDNCFSAATVSGYYAGGLIADIYGNTGNFTTYLSNSTFVGAASSDVASAGLVAMNNRGAGSTWAGRYAEVTNCRNAGTITGTSSAFYAYPGANTKVIGCVNVGTAHNNRFFVNQNSAVSTDNQDLSATPDAAWTNVNYVGSQVKKNEDGTYSVRFLATVNDLKAFNEVGFQIVAAYGTTTSDAAKGTFTTSKVFTSVGANANGVASTANPATWGGKYFVAVTVSNITIDETVTFTVNTLQDGTPSATAYTVAYQDGVLVAA